MYVDDELKRMRKKEVLAYFNILPLYFPRGTGESHKRYQSTPHSVVDPADLPFSSTFHSLIILMMCSKAKFQNNTQNAYLCLVNSMEQSHSSEGKNLSAGY
jgi:hypothetical protein